MHILFLRDVTDPDTHEILYRKGQDVDRERAVCVPYLDRGAAVIVPKAERGSKEWFAQRMRQASMPRQVHANDNSTAAPTLVPGWGIVKRGAPERYFIQQTTAGEVLLYEGVPVGCPASVAAQLVELNGLSVQSPEAIEARRIAQCEKVNAELANKERDQSALARIFGGK